jgi:cobaltochelatase CobT
MPNWLTIMTKAEFTDQIHRKRLAAAWAKAYGDGHDASKREDVDEESRPVADARAAWRRWHDASLDRRWSAAEWPWFEVLERARVEQLASNHLPGIARNLANPDCAAPPPGLRGDLYRSARRIFAGAGHQDEPVFRSNNTRGIYQYWKNWLSRRRARPSESEIVAALHSARQWLEDPTDFADTIEPLIHILSELEETGSGGSPTQPSAIPTNSLTTEEREATESDDNGAIIKRPGENGADPEVLRVDPTYNIYSTAWDEEGPAEEWLRPHDKEFLRSLLSPDRLKIRQLAHKLQRRLLAASMRHWQFDQDEGLLDPRRLCRLIGEKTNHRIFRHEKESPIPSACVCFLVDLSGSMRGERLRIAATTVDLAAHTLERCGIEVEVLGYTTTFGANNPLATEWKRAGCPKDPGRLNAVRHVVFKSTNQRWRRARHTLGLMLREDFGHENIDGEALHWAARRLSSKPNPNRILMVLSDGQPYDEATTSSNGRGFLEEHLRSIIKEIEQSHISLIALGAGMSVSRFYTHSVTINDPTNLGERLFKNLEELLVVSQDATGHR